MSPILPTVPGYKIWMVWLAIAVALLIAKPWGVFSWDEWLVLAAPMLLIHPAVRRAGVLVGGLVASGVAWLLLGEQSGGWPELVCLWAILVAGTAIAFSATQGGRDQQSSRSSPLDQMNTEDLFFDALNRELSRTRRDDSSFAVLSLDRKAEDNDTSLRQVCELLDAELRAYADIAQVDKRVLALVPEVEDNQVEPLLKRITEKAEAVGCAELRIGLSRFPQDAICAEDLIVQADRKRLVRGVTPVSTESPDHPQDQVSM